MKLIVFLVPLFFFISFVKEVHIASRYAQNAGLDLSETIELWGREKSTSENFTGAELGAVLRVDRAFYSLIIFGLISFIAYGGLKYRAKDA